jgi:hypothetical protein
LLQQTAGEQQAGAVRSRVALECHHQAVLGELRRACRAQDLITSNLSVHDLAKNKFVGESNNQAVLG